MMRPASDLQISVVVPTYRRPGLLERCLQALVSQRFGRDRYEIIVVDDGDDEATRDAVLAFQAHTAQHPPLRYLVARDTQGPAAARNLGWRRARGQVIAFTDDDTLPQPDWLARGWEAMRGGAAAAAGHIHVPVPPRPTDYEADVAGLDGAEFATANCFVRRDVMERLGGFDERFELAWREDSDLQFQLLRAGLPVARANDAIVVHPIRPAGWGVSVKQQRKIQYDALLYKKHPALYREKIRRAPRWDYYLIVLALAVAAGAALAGLRGVAGFGLGVWAAMSLRFIASRLHARSTKPSHVLEMALTSLAIPPVATFWRVAGALRYRVLFL